MERTSRRGRMLGAMLMVVGALTLFMAGTAGAEIDPAPATTTHGIVPDYNPDDNPNAKCADIGLPDAAQAESENGEAGQTGTAEGDGLVVNWTFNDNADPDLDTIDFEVDETSEYWVAAAIVKQASDQSDGGVFVYRYDPPVESDTGLIDPRGDGEFSHITFCGGEIPPPEADLTIVKVATGEVPDGWSVDFTGDAGSFTLGEAEGDTEGPQTVDPGTYVVAETLTDDFDLTDITCTGATSFTPDLDAGSVSIELADGDDATCTFTNDYPEADDSVVVNNPPEEPAVFGEQVTRTPAAQPTQVEQLAFTGSGTERLAVAGLAMVLLGTVLVLGDRRRRAEV